MSNNKRESDSDDEGEMLSKNVLGEKSNIQIGFALVLAGFIVGAIWWAATMQSKMDQVIEEVKVSQAQQVRMNENETKIKLIEMRMMQLESYCTKK
jgi:hypothetical protein